MKHTISSPTPTWCAMPANRFGCGMLPDPLQCERISDLLSSNLKEMSFREMNCEWGRLRWEKSKEISKILPFWSKELVTRNYQSADMMHLSVHRNLSSS